MSVGGRCVDTVIVWVVGVWDVGVLVYRYKMSELSSHQILWNTLPVSLVSNSYVPHFRSHVWMHITH